MSGNVNVDAMLRSITAKQFMEWEMYYRTDPFDERRADYRNAMLCALIANIVRGKKGKAFTADDFLLEFKELKAPTRNQSVQEKSNILMMMAKALAAK
jgi:hypothetical protein